MIDRVSDQRRGDDQYSDEETERRATDALRRSLTTPHTPQKAMVGKVGAPYRSGPRRRSRPIDKGKDQP